MAFYTGNGDSGKTNTLGKSGIDKYDELFEAEGDLDELNCQIGLAAYYVSNEKVHSMLKSIQNELFIIGAKLASLGASNVAQDLKFGDENTKRLEREIDELSAVLPQYKKFIIPGGCEGAVHLQLARAVARRAERTILKLNSKYTIDQSIKSYMNRLSSYLFVAALYINHLEGIDEEHPVY